MGIGTAAAYSCSSYGYSSYCSSYSYYYARYYAHELGHLVGGLQHTFDPGEVVTDTCTDRYPSTEECSVWPVPENLCIDGDGPRATTGDPADSLSGCPSPAAVNVPPNRNVMSYNRLYADSWPYFSCNEGDYLSDQQEDMSRCHVSTRWSVYQPSLPLAGPASETCDNGVDDDGDSYVDCNDFDCGEWCSQYEYSGSPYCWNDPPTFAAGDTVGQPCCGMTSAGGVEYRVGLSAASALTAPIATWWTTADEYGCTPWTWTSPLSWASGTYFLTALDQTTGEWAQATTYEVQ